MPYVAPADVVTGTTITSAWGDSVKAAADYLANPPACRVYNSANFSHNSSGNWLAVTFDSERFDTDGMHSTSTNTSRITFNTAGLYEVHASLAWQNNGTGRRLVAIRRNGSATDVLASSEAPPNAGESSLVVSTLYKFAAADYVEMIAFQSSGGTLSVLRLTNYSPEFSAVWVGLG